MKNISNVLIAEDESRLAAFLEKGLKKKGFSTTVVSDGSQTVEMASKEEYELLLLDLGLPKIDGLRVLEELRNQEKTLPIIVITALNDNHTRLNALNLGADDFIAKPFSFKYLLQRIELQLNKLKCNS